MPLRRCRRCGRRRHVDKDDDADASVGGSDDDELLLDADGLGELRAFSPVLVLACDRHADAVLNATSSAPSGARPPPRARRPAPWGRPSR